MSELVEIRQSRIEGRGAYAKSRIPAGSIIMEMGGRHVNLLQCGWLIATQRLRFDDPLQIGPNAFIALDALSVSINSSCAPNATICRRNTLMAIRDIEEGAEITFDYALTVLPSVFNRRWSMTCLCGAPNCRKTIGNLASVPAATRDLYVRRGWLQDYVLAKIAPTGQSGQRLSTTPNRTIRMPGGKTGVLLLHGLSGAPDEMRELGETLAARGHTVLIPQLAGHSGRYDDLKMARWQEWAESAREALFELSRGCDRIMVGGLSMGAILALHMAAKHPERVKAVAVLAPTLWLNGWMVPPHAYLFNLVTQRWCADYFDFPDLPPYGVKDATIRARVLAAMTGTHPGAPLLVTPGRSVLEHRWLVDSVKKDMPSIKQPALIIYPREDDYAHFNNVGYLLQNLGGRVDTLTLEDSYHIITVDRQRRLVFERTNEFAAKVLSSERDTENGATGFFPKAGAA